MKSKLDRRSARDRYATKIEKQSTFIKRGGQSVESFLRASLYCRGVCPLIFGERASSASKRLRGQRAHLKRSSHAKMKYGMSPFAIQLDIKNFAWHTSISAFSASNANCIPVPYRPTALIVRPVISLACSPRQTRDN